MGKMEEMAAKLATKYGTVTEGKHKGCQVALGNDPSQKVETSWGFKQIIFVEGDQEKGRYDIINDLKEIQVLTKTDDGYKLQLFYNSGEVSTFVLEIRPNDSVVKGMLKKLLGQKTTFGAPEQEQQLLKYRGVRVFFNATYLKYPYDQAMSFISDFASLGIQENLDDTIVQQLKKLHHIED